MPTQVCEYVISNIYWNLANVAQLYKDIDDENDEDEGGGNMEQAGTALAKSAYLQSLIMRTCNLSWDGIGDGAGKLRPRGAHLQCLRENFYPRREATSKYFLNTFLIA